MQARVKNRKIVRDARVEIISNYWRKILHKVELNCGRKDKKTAELLRKIIIVPEKVMNEAL